MSDSDIIIGADDRVSPTTTTSSSAGPSLKLPRLSRPRRAPCPSITIEVESA